MIQDSGNRREFNSGAVRDIQEGKGRCDLLPLDVISLLADKTGRYDKSSIFYSIYEFMKTGKIECLITTLSLFASERYGLDWNTLILEVSIHFEEGAKKYGDNNWRKGIPVRCYIDSAIRHYLKYSRGDKDEPHDRAFAWNIICCIWTCRNKPDLNEYAIMEASE